MASCLWGVSHGELPTASFPWRVAHGELPMASCPRPWRVAHVRGELPTSVASCPQRVAHGELPTAVFHGEFPTSMASCPRPLPMASYPWRVGHDRSNSDMADAESWLLAGDLDGEEVMDVPFPISSNHGKRSRRKNQHCQDCYFAEDNGIQNKRLEGTWRTYAEKENA
ncbi:hypothetical protein Bca4012_083943 [Brassica carinata]